MTDTVIIDASAATRAVMDAAGQTALIDRIAEAGDVRAPSLLRIETANALWKYVRAGILDSQEAQRRHTDAMTLVRNFEGEQSLFPEALHLAVTADHPVYDAVYVVAARRSAATVLTFDRRLRALCTKAQVRCELYAT